MRMTSSLMLLLLSFLSTSLAVAEEDVVLGDALAILQESDAQRWTDLDAKKLESQKKAHDEELKTVWAGLDKQNTLPQDRLNFVHVVRQHPAEVHVAHAQKSVLEVEFRDAGDIREISLGGVKKAETSGATASVMTVVGLGLVAFVIVIGVVRYRASSASRRGAAGGDAADRGLGADDYHWDDELNIIVNPMEEQGSAGAVDYEDQELPLRDDFSEDSEMSDRELDLEQGDMEDLSSEDEEEMPGVTIATANGVKELRSCRGLEWDDSTI